MNQYFCVWGGVGGAIHVYIHVHAGDQATYNIISVVHYLNSTAC